MRKRGGRVAALLGALAVPGVVLVVLASMSAGAVAAASPAGTPLARERASAHASLREMQAHAVPSEAARQHKAPTADHATPPAAAPLPQPAAESKKPSTEAPGGLGGPSGSPLSPLVAPGAGRPAAPQQLGARSGEAVARSHQLVGLDAAQAAQLDREVFSVQVGRPAGGLPSLPAGQRITRVISPQAAQVALPHGKHAVIESMVPFAQETSHGHEAPVDLGLRRVGGGFESVRPLVGVLIGHDASEGFGLPEAGVSLTPADAHGAALAGAEGQIDGASVVFANTQQNSDTVVKPTTGGLDASTILRAAGQSEVYYRVGMPVGAHLAQPSGQSAPVEVIEGGHPIASIQPPRAVDAQGAQVPATMKVDGDLLQVAVADAGDHQLPIVVDPELRGQLDWELGIGECHHTGEAERESSNWCWSTNSGGFSPHWYWEAVRLENTSAVNAGEYGVVSYHTQGDSKIYYAGINASGDAPKGAALLEFARERSSEVGELEVPRIDVFANGSKTYESFPEYTRYCVREEGYECSLEAGSEHNLVAYKLEAWEPQAAYAMSAYLDAAEVAVTQERGPEVGVNTTEEHPEEDRGRENVEYTHAWLSPESGAYELVIHDPGVGVSAAGVHEVGGYKYLVEAAIFKSEWSDNKCNGIQCNENFREALTYSAEMPDGEDEFEAWAGDKVGLYGYHKFHINVDGTPPDEIGFTGIEEEGAEISAAPHAITVHATDGTAPTPSSGVKSITVSVDGGAPAEATGGTCSPGPCTASGQYTLHGEGLSEGVHRLIVTATDNAGNVAAREYTFDIRHATPIAVGPGTVDPTTGQLKLSATDVALAGSGGVSRVYQSRNPDAGADGPLGPQWALSLGGGQGITALPDGSAVLSSSNGGTTTFARAKNGEYLAPLGDTNIKLQAKEEKQGSGISEYLLSDAKAGTTTVFTQPGGTEDTLPAYIDKIGVEDPEAGSLARVAVDAHGNIWATNAHEDRVLEFSPAGVLLHAFGAEGSLSDEFRNPIGIAINKITGNVYIADDGNSRIIELNSSGVFVRAFGWEVKPGNAEESDDCLSNCWAGKAGSGEGQLDVPQGIAVDPGGNVWVAELHNRRIQEFSETGQYLHAYGTGGTGAGQFEDPMNIAFQGEDVYVTDMTSNRIDVFTTAGAFVKAFGEGVSNGEEKPEVCTTECRAGIAGSGPGEFHYPSGLAISDAGDLYVSEPANHQVQELTAEGSHITQFGSGDVSAPDGVALGTLGQIYAADYSRGLLQWMRSTWLPIRTEGALKHVSTAYAYKPVEIEGQPVVEPTEALAATPDGIECVGPKGEVEPQYLKDGCRALSFNYAEATTAKGEAPGEWGDYRGHMTRVYFHGYDPASKAMKTSEVAHYLYDAKGRLRAEWDPRTEPKPEAEECVAEPLGKGCLVTTYGYDEEGHVTSVTAPHQESWALTYGTSAGDGDGGRLLKVRRAPASAKLWAGEGVGEKEAPKLSGTPVLGVRMAVSEGQWSGEPVSYGYQWEDCNAAGGECSPIDGATNANYTPRSSDVGHTLAARVTVTNGGGSVTVATGASAVVASSWQEHSASSTQLVDGASSINAVSCQAGSTTCVISDANGNAFYASNVSASGAASWKAWSGPGEGPSEAIDCPSSGLCLMAAGKDAGAGGNLYYATSLGGSWTEAYSPVWGVDAISCVSASFCVDGQDGWGYFRYSTNPASSSWELLEQGSASTVAMKGVSCVSSAFCAIVDSTGNVHVATSEAQVKSSVWTETNIDGSTALNGIACMSSSSCVAVDATGDVLSLTIANGAVSSSKQNIDAANALTGVSCAGGSTCVAVDDVGNVFVSGDGGGTWKKAYVPGGDLTSVSCASSSLCVAANTAGDVVSFDPALTQAVDGVSGLNAVSCIPGSTTCVVTDAKGGAYYATNVSATSPATWQSWTGPGTGPSEALDCPSSGLCLMAAGEHEGYGGSMYYATSLGGSWTQAYSPLYGIDAISCVSSSFCADGQDGGGYFRYATSPASSSWELESQGSAAMKGITCLSASFCAIADSAGNVHVATSEAQVKSSSWKQTSIDGSTPLNGIACTSTSSCVAVDDAGNLLNLSIAAEGAATVSKQNIDGSASLTAIACTGSTTCAAVDAQGKVFISTDGGKTWEDRYQLKDDLTSVSCASASLCAAADTSGQLSAFAPSSGKAGSSYTQPVDAGSTLNAVSCVPGSTDCVISDGNGNAFYATNVSTTGTPSWKAWGGPGEGPSGALTCPGTSLCLMATGKSAYGGAPVYYATGLGGEWKTAYTKSYGVESLSCASASFCVAGNIDAVFGWSEAPTSSWSTRHQEPYVVGNNIKGVACLSSAFCAMASAQGYVYTALSTAQIESESWVKTDVDGSTALNGIGCPSTHECLAVDTNGNVLNLAIAGNGTITVAKRDIDGANSLNAISCSGSTCAVVDGKGNVFTSTDGGQIWNDQYTPGGDLTGVSCASASLCVTISKEGETTAFNAAGIASEASQQSPQPGTTIEYRVPVSGEGAPQNLSKEEVEKWGQKDDPQEATAIFPPDEPQGWPAAGYKKATIDYMDEQGRTVNTRAPGGGIATTEYNEANEAVRSLSPDNRATALAAGAKSLEVAEHLSAITEYNPFDNQIIKTLGPEHKVKLPGGEEVQARAVTHNYYNEGAQQAEEKNQEEYNLLTKTVGGALLSNGEEKDKRTTLSSYNGQEDLGWKLRKPTSTTVDPEGLKLTTTTQYDASTGEVVESRAPSGKGSEYTTHTAEYLSGWGGRDTEPHVLEPQGVAVGPEGDIWVADTGDSRVVKLNAKGEFIAAFGSEGSEAGQFKHPGAIAVDAKGDVWVADSNNDRIQELSPEGTFMRAFGTEGTGNGQFKYPYGIAVDSEGNVWVADSGNGRLQEFSATGEFIRTVGGPGKENGEFNDPRGLTVESNGDIVVADMFNGRVQKFSSAGAYISQFEAEYPIAVAAASNGNLVVANGTGGWVSEFSSSGQELARVDTAGSGEGQLQAAVGVAVDGSGDVWVADAAASGGVLEFSPATPALGYVWQFGREGTGEGQFKDPTGMAVNAENDVWSVDTGNDRVEEFSPFGKLMQKIGAAGEGEGQFQSPTGIAIDKEGDLWVADTGNKRVQEFSSTGSHLAQFNTATAPSGIATNAEGDVWVTEQATDEIREYSSAGAELQHCGGKGTSDGKFETPAGIAVDKEGHVWVADEGNNRIQEFSGTGEYLAQFAVEKPRGLRFDAAGDLWVARAAGVVQKLSPSGQALESFGAEGAGDGQFNDPWGIALDANGHAWVADSGNDRLQEVGPIAYAYTRRFPGISPMQFADPKGLALDSAGNVWVADTQNNRVQEVSAEGKFLEQWESHGRTPEGIAVDASGRVWVTDAGTDEVIEVSPKGGWTRFGSAGTGNGQFKAPSGIAIAGAYEYVVDRGNDRVQELTSNGEYIRQFGEAGSGDGQLSEPQGVAVDANGDVWVADTGNNRIEEFSAEGTYIAAYGTAGSGDGQFNKPEGVAIDKEGNVWVGDTGNNRVQELSPNGGYLQQFASEGAGSEQLQHPAALAVNGANEVYVLDTGNGRVEKWKVRNVLHEKAGSETAATRTIYYTAEKEASIEACQNHPEWASLPCRSEPVSQPADVKEGKPRLPVTTMTYNIWDEVETSTEEFGSVTRTKTQTYDAAGRALTSQETSTSTDKALPTVTNEYNPETGALEKQTATINGQPKTILAKDNTLGQLVEYQDGSGNTAHYTYEEGGDARPLETREGDGVEAESKQTYSYNNETGLMSKLVDSAAGTFEASYDLEGKMTSEIYPNGMCANTSYDTTGTATGISYIKTRNCAEEHPTVWFSDSIVPGIHGETISQESTLASERYSYDTTGRLTETQETPAGKGCTIRLYSYDEASNRLSQTTRTPATEGKCASEGGTIERHLYDEANRLTDEGIEYEALGNTTVLPAADAEGHEIKTSYYLDGQAATQEQNGVADSYIYDPAGRTMETTSEKLETKATVTTVSHYAGASAAVTWSSQGAEKWSRNIPGIGGGLQATEESDKVVTLQLADLQGNIVATASDYESETKLRSTYNSTEFGVPSEGIAPPKYAWLGASGLATETTFGTGASTQGGASYIPQVARDLQTAPVVPPGAFPNGQGTGTQYGSEIPGWYVSLSGQESAATLAEYTARQEALAREMREARESQENLCRTVTGTSACEGGSNDPTVYFTRQEAWEKAWKLEHLDEYAQIAELISLLGGVSSETIIGGIIAEFTSGKIESWIEESEEFLNYCVNELWEEKDAKYGRCKYSVADFPLTKVPNFYVAPVVSWCAHYKKKCTLEVYSTGVEA